MGLKYFVFDSVRDVYENLLPIYFGVVEFKLIIKITV